MKVVIYINVCDVYKRSNSQEMKHIYPLEADKLFIADSFVGFEPRGRALGTRTIAVTVIPTTVILATPGKQNCN